MQKQRRKVKRTRGRTAEIAMRLEKIAITDEPPKDSTDTEKDISEDSMEELTQQLSNLGNNKKRSRRRKASKSPPAKASKKTNSSPRAAFYDFQLISTRDAELSEDEADLVFLLQEFSVSTANSSRYMPYIL